MLLPDGQPPITTREALEGFAVSRFSRYRPNIQIAADEIQIIGDWAFSRTTVTGTLTPRGGGNPLRVDGKEIALYRRQPNGGWKLARLIANSSSR
jgi:ketosteroid isomerase-like protein